MIKFEDHIQRVKKLSRNETAWNVRTTEPNLASSQPRLLNVELPKVNALSP